MGEIAFPTIGPVSYTNDFLASRSNGIHHATDLMANKGQQVVAAASGTIKHVAYPQPRWGYSVFIRGDDGMEYAYIHLNNDNPGTDDGYGDGRHAYAPDIVRGNRVVKGQHLGYVGDSGDAEETGSHLHFEMYDNNTAVNPYEYLREAEREGRVYNTPATYPQLPHELLPFGNMAYIGVNIALANLDAQSALPETIVGAGAGGGPHVKVYTDKQQLFGFFAYDRNFRGGVDVASGDVDGDGKSNIVTSPGISGGPQLKVFDENGKFMWSRFAYKTTDRRGLKTAVGKLTSGVGAQIVTVPNTGSGPHLKIFDNSGRLLRDFFAYDKSLRTGMDVTTADVDGDGLDEVVTSLGPGGSPKIRIFNYSGQLLREFSAYGSDFRGGVRVSSANIDKSTPGDEIVVAPASSGGPQIKILQSDGKVFATAESAFEVWWRGGYDIAAHGATLRSASGENRRASVRDWK